MIYCNNFIQDLTWSNGHDRPLLHVKSNCLIYFELQKEEEMKMLTSKNSRGLTILYKGLKF